MTKISGEATARPPSTATEGSAANALAASRGKRLVSSAVEPLRRKMAFSREPVAFKVSSTPAASIRTAAKTKTTRPRPAAVAKAEKRRRRIERTLYESGIIYSCLRSASTTLICPARQAGAALASAPMRMAETRAAVAMPVLRKSGKPNVWSSPSFSGRRTAAARSSTAWFPARSA